MIQNQYNRHHLARSVQCQIQTYIKMKILRQLCCLFHDILVCTMPPLERTPWSELGLGYVVHLWSFEKNNQALC